MMKRKMFGRSIGWLFVDLLLVLTMLFLAINTTGARPPSPLLTPTPTTKPLLHLEQKYHRFTIKVNRAALLKDDATTISSVKQQITSQTFLQGRSAGLIIVYGVATSTATCQSEGAYTVATKVYNLVQQLSKSNATFSNVVNYDPSCKVKTDVNQIIIEIYLFAQG